MSSATKKVRSIAFKVRLQGAGGVNYDDTQLQKYHYNRLAGMAGINTQYDNCNLHKGNYYAVEGLDKEGKVTTEIMKKLKISAQCLRANIFKNVQPVYKSDIHMDERFIKFISSKSAVLKGYMFPSTAQGSLKRKSPFTIIDAEQISATISSINVGTSRDSSKVIDEDGNETTKKTETTLYYREQFGEITYEASGIIDLAELAFISFDDRYLRKACSSDYIEQYQKYIDDATGYKESARGYFEKAMADIRSMELGLLLSNNQVVELVRYIFTLILNTEIRSAYGFAEVTGVSIRYIYQDDINSKCIDMTKPVETFGTVITDPSTIHFEFDPAYARVEDSVADAWVKDWEKIDKELASKRLKKAQDKAEADKKKKEDRAAKKTVKA